MIIATCAGVADLLSFEDVVGVIHEADDALHRSPGLAP